MLHAPILAAAGPAFAPPSEPPLTPAGYVRLRRESAGLSTADVADGLAKLRLRTLPRGALTQNEALEDARALVDQLETPGVKARHRATIAALAAVFPIDPDVYQQLCTEPADRHPTICRGCGASRYDDLAPAHCACSTGAVR